MEQESAWVFKDGRLGSWIARSPREWIRHERAERVELTPGKPDADEDRFTALSNSLVFSECVDVPDTSIPDAQGVVGSSLLKQIMASVKARNPQLRYIGFFQLARADTFIAGGAGVVRGDA